MGYRDDQEQLRTRIGELERELGETRRQVARLEGRVPAPSGSEASRLLGVPLLVEREVELEFEVQDDVLAAVADALQARLPGSISAQVGGVFTNRRGQYELRIVRQSGRTRIQSRGDYRTARLGYFLGSPGLMLIAAVLLGAAGALGGPWGVGIGLVMGMAAGALGLRALMRHSILRDQRTVSGLFDAVVSIATSHQERLAQPVRVVVGDTAEAKAEDAGAADRAALAQEEAAHGEVEAGRQRFGRAE